MNDQSKDYARGPQQPEPAPGKDGPRAGMRWLVRRKKIVARELHGTEALAGQQTSPTACIMEASTDPAAQGLNESIMDPTVMGERRRKRSHNFTYRLTIVAIAAGALSSMASIAYLAVEHVPHARIIATLALAVAVLSLRLTRLNRLSGRLMGYAVAGIIIASLALALCLAFPAPHHPKTPAPATIRSTGGQSAGATTQEGADACTLLILETQPAYAGIGAFTMHQSGYMSLYGIPASGARNPMQVCPTC